MQLSLSIFKSFIVFLLSAIILNFLFAAKRNQHWTFSLLSLSGPAQRHECARHHWETGPAQHAQPWVVHPGHVCDRRDRPLRGSRLALQRPKDLKIMHGCPAVVFMVCSALGGCTGLTGSSSLLFHPKRWTAGQSSLTPPPLPHVCVLYECGGEFSCVCVRERERES